MLRINLENDKYPAWFILESVEFWIEKNKNKPRIGFKSRNTTCIFLIDDSESEQGFDLNNDFFTQEYFSKFKITKEDFNENNFDKLDTSHFKKLKKYKMTSGLTGIKEEPYFTNKIDAWNYLSSKHDTSRWQHLLEQRHDTFYFTTDEDREKYYEQFKKENDSEKTVDFMVPVLFGSTTTRLTHENI